MSVPPGWGDPETVPTLIAQHIVNTAVIANPIVTRDYLSNAISEVTPETQTAGPALLQLTLIDPDWVIARSGICSRDANGLLQPVDVNFPEGTPVWWRLAMIDFSSDFTQPNLTLTFQHRTIAYLMRCFKSLGWPSSKVGTTRAQFIDFLLHKMPSELPKNLIGPTTADGRGAPNDFRFVCPELNEIIPVANSDEYGTEIVTSQNAAAKAAGINKLPSVTAASHVTIKAKTPTPQQIADINTAIGQAQALKASQIATEALLCAGIGESTFNRYSTNGSHQGIWQSDEIPGDQVAQQAAAFLQGGQSFQAGGAMKLSATISDPGQIATMVEAGGEPASFYGQWLPEAQTIIHASGALLLNKGLSTVPTSDVASLERGTSDDPDEDSWTCIQRLATEVNWNIFSDPQPHPGQWGNFIYYIDGPTLVAQKPALYLSLSDTGNVWSVQDPETGKFLDGSDGDGMVTNLTATMDNSAVQVYQGVEVAASNGVAGSAKITKQTRIQTPQTPSQMMFDLILGGQGVLTYNAGKVVVVRNAGPLDGRWIIMDDTHNIMGDLFAQLTLGPPIFAYPEPQANTTTVVGTNGQPITVSTGSGSASSTTKGTVSLTSLKSIQQGALSGVAQAAQLALAQQQAKHVYVYFEQKGAARSEVTDLFSPVNGPRIMDCSKFTTLCYKAAGLPDPNHFNYNPIGNTSSLIAHCKPIAAGSAQPGDMTFFGSTTPSGAYATVHVNVYVGNGQCVNMGSAGEPKLDPVGAGPSSFLGFFRSDVVSTITAAPLATNTNPVVPAFSPLASPAPLLTSTGSSAGMFASIWHPGGDGAP